MASFGSTVLRENLMRRLFEQETDVEWLPLTTIDVALFLTVADPTLGSNTEIVGTGYARENVAFGAWTVGAGPDFIVENAVTIDFGNMAADWVDGGLNQILAFGLFDNGTGDFEVVGDLDSPVTIAAGLPLVFLAGTIRTRLL